MDLTTLTLFLMVIASAVGADTVLHPASVVLDATVSGKIDKLTVNSATLADMLAFEATQICSTPSVLAAPEVRPDASKSIGLALADAVKLGSVAIALQSQFGYEPERIKVTMLSEDGVTKMLINGAGMGGRIQTPPFQELIALKQGEDLTAFVHRAAVLGMAKIDPYFTSLYLVHTHTGDGDFSWAEALIKETKAQLPQTLVNFDRSVFENLQGIIALRQDKPDDAASWFHTAIASDPDDAAPALNAAFVDLWLGNYQKAVEHVDELLRVRVPTDKILLATAYMTAGAALFRLNDLKAADHRLAEAVRVNPSSATAYQLWSEVKRAEGDTATADKLHAKAWQTAGPTESYTEVAALHFGLIWKPGEKLKRSPLKIPGLIRYN